MDDTAASRSLPRWFDAHLDLAYMAVNGRDMAAAPINAGGPDLPGCVTLTSLAAGGVHGALATIFTEADGRDAVGYPADDAEAAHAAGLAQLQVYQTWRTCGRVQFLDEGLSPVDTPGFSIGILMECADPIRTPAEAGWWREQGVVAVGLAWARGSRYADGNSEASAAKGRGITAAGKELVAEFDRIGIVHDASHLSDKAFDDLLATAKGRIIASHSNCRALIDIPESPTNQRHLTDDQIRAIGRRGGIIGINLFSPFLIRGGVRSRRATMVELCNHIDRTAELAGGRDRVALGSDMDGGFSARMLPEGIDSPADLAKLDAALAARGWSDQDRRNFAWNTWARFWSLRD